MITNLTAINQCFVRLADVNILGVEDLGEGPLRVHVECVWTIQGCRLFALKWGPGPLMVTSPKALCWVRSGVPCDAPDSLASTSTDVPKYCWSMIRGFPSTRHLPI